MTTSSIIAISDLEELSDDDEVKLDILELLLSELSEDIVALDIDDIDE